MVYRWGSFILVGQKVRVRIMVRVGYKEAIAEREREREYHVKEMFNEVIVECFVFC